jgi:hypothetical protein
MKQYGLRVKLRTATVDMFFRTVEARALALEHLTEHDIQAEILPKGWDSVEAVATM